jgi:hypothetical protein
VYYEYPYRLGLALLGRKNAIRTLAPNAVE